MRNGIYDPPQAKGGTQTVSNETRAELAQQLRKLGIEMVTAEYNGSGDGGQIETPEFGSVKVPSVMVTDVENFFYELLEDLYSGWDNNEGAFGQFEWNVKDDRINLVHNMRTESYDTEKQYL
jgi:uncharacterized protein DUF6878